MDAVILLIEPHPLHAKLFSDVIRMHGFSCVTSSTGREGIAIATCALPQLVILDLVLPDFDGRDVIHLIRKETRTAAIPIIVLTAADGPQNKYDCAVSGATAFIGKPVRLTEFRKQIENALNLEAAFT